MTVSGRSTFRAAAWAFLGTGVTRVVTLVSLAVLARLLAPRDFGLLAFALVYITYAETVGDLGTAVALVYWPDRRGEAADVTFAINVAMGLFWCGLTLLLAPYIAGFFHNPDAAPIVRVLAFGFLIKFLGNTHDALAQKDLRFRARVVPEVGLALVKAGLSIGLAVAGFGAWSLVWGHMAGLLIWTIGTWIIVPWRPTLRVARDLVGPMLRYGRSIVAVNMIGAVAHHADLAIVGRALGSTALGLYQLADRIPDSVVLVLVYIISKVLFPAFARIRDDDALRRAYLKALKYVSATALPVAIGLAVAAEPLVRVAFGPKWMEAVPILRWLAIYAGVRALGTHAGDVLKATGRPGLLAWFGAFKAAFVVIAMIAAARYGAVAIAMSLAIATAFTVWVNVLVVKRLLHFSWTDVVRALRASVAAAGALAGSALLAQRWVGGGATAELLVMSLTGALAYVVVLYGLDRDAVMEVVRALSRDRTVAAEANGAPLIAGRKS